ncbi:MAG TPA: hypothetical protein VMU57_18370 [Edaphobacter sp.]|uniref:hypothetical protein n=1 Tax=Edaphobacter sp. TaxID=1934404 RepID=UPI002C632217|nr:hypothetical protein [Edaphobacter sp.]HUZ96874.1 hypothetical protein [Edaphobacter sp.]
MGDVLNQPGPAERSPGGAPECAVSVSATSGSGCGQRHLLHAGRRIALVYQQHATAASRARLKSLFSGKPGVLAALTPEEAAKQGWPTLAQSDQAPDPLLSAANGYAFDDGATGEYVTPTKEVGAHGYPNSDPLMQASFIAEGSGIKPIGEIPAFPNLDVTPTIARLLHSCCRRFRASR